MAYFRQALDYQNPFFHCVAKCTSSTSTSSTNTAANQNAQSCFYPCHFAVSLPLWPLGTQLGVLFIFKYKYNVSFRFTNVLWAGAWWNFKLKKAILTKPCSSVRVLLFLQERVEDVLQPRRCLNCLTTSLQIEICLASYIKQDSVHEKKFNQ